MPLCPIRTLEHPSETTSLEEFSSMRILLHLVLHEELQLQGKPTVRAENSEFIKLPSHPSLKPTNKAHLLP